MRRFLHTIVGSFAVFLLSYSIVYAHHDDPIATEAFVTYWRTAAIFIDSLSFSFGAILTFWLLSHLLANKKIRIKKKRLLIVSSLISGLYVLISFPWYTIPLYPGYNPWTLQPWYLDFYIAHPTLYVPHLQRLLFQDHMEYLIVFLGIVTLFFIGICWLILRFIGNVKSFRIASIVFLITSTAFSIFLNVCINSYRLIYPFKGNKYEFRSQNEKIRPPTNPNGTTQTLTFNRLQFLSPPGWWVKQDPAIYQLHPYVTDYEMPIFYVEKDTLARSFNQAIFSFAGQLDPDSIEIRDRTLEGFPMTIIKGVPIVDTFCRGSCKIAVIQVGQDRYIIEGIVGQYEREFDALVASIKILPPEQARDPYIDFIAVEYGKCQPHTILIPTAQGNASFIIHGKRDGSCVVSYEPAGNYPALRNCAVSIYSGTIYYRKTASGLEIDTNRSITLPFEKVCPTLLQ